SNFKICISMTDKDKKRFHDLADKDKQRYETEMKDYTPSENDKRKSKKRKKKDPNAPKRPLSKVKEVNPEYTAGDTSKELGRRWSEIDPSVKGKYQELADKEKARYDKVSPFLFFPIFQNDWLNLMEERKLGQHVRNSEMSTRTSRGVAAPEARFCRAPPPCRMSILMRGNIPNRFVYMLNRMRPSRRRYIAALARHFFSFPKI
ncbi:unnamed protein product, partial [Nesidiocoris tenuis]